MPTHPMADRSRVGGQLPLEVERSAHEEDEGEPHDHCQDDPAEYDQSY